MRFIRCIVLVLMVAGSLMACSPQRRLQRILQQHPELRAPDSLHVIDSSIAIPGAKNTVLLPELKDDTCHCDSLIRAALQDGLTVNAGNAIASILPTDSGLILQAEQVPDTITIHDTVPVPQYVIKTAPREESDIERFFRCSGIIAWILMVIAIVVMILSIFIRL